MKNILMHAMSLMFMFFTLTAFMFDDAADFSEGLAEVELDSKPMFINQKGEIVIDPQCHLVGSFSQGLAVTYDILGNNRRRLQFIDKTGKIILDLGTRFNSGGFHWTKDGFSVVSTGEYKHGVIDRKGQLAIPCTYDQILPREREEGISCFRV